MGIINLPHKVVLRIPTINGAPESVIECSFLLRGNHRDWIFVGCSSLVVFHIDYTLNAALGKGVLKPEAIKH